MSKEKTLAPTTGILMTAMQSGMSHIDAAAEFVDNSFGPAAGNADNITIVDAKDAVLFLDQGNGVSDINLLFRLGDGQSRNSGNDIGRFGVGSKFGALAYGKDVEVHTVRNGVYHTFRVNWAAVLDSGKWPACYTGKGKNARHAPRSIRSGGTLIAIRKIHEGRSRPIKSTYVKELGLRFQVALLDGKDITYCRATSLRAFLNGKVKDRISIAEAFEGHLESALTGKGQADLSFSGKGMESDLMFGKLRDGDKKLSGVHVSYAGRTVEVLSELMDEDGEIVQVPGKFFGRVVLGSGWKDCLNYNKTKIVDRRDDLLAAIYLEAKKLIEQMSSDESSEVLEKLSAHLSNMISPELGQRLIKGANKTLALADDDGTEEVLDIDEDGTKPHQGHDNVTPIKPKSAKAGETHSGAGGLFKFDVNKAEDGALGRAAKCKMVRSGHTIICKIDINTELHLMKKTVVNNPANRPATMLVCLNALSEFMVRNPAWIDQMFDADTANDIHQEGQIDQHSAIYDELVRSVVEEAA